MNFAIFYAGTKLNRHNEQRVLKTSGNKVNYYFPSRASFTSNLGICDLST